MRLCIISGSSGAGKSTALHALEDLGYYCIDNLPLALLPAFALELTKSPGHGYDKAAIGIDVRNLTVDLSLFPDTLHQIKAAGIETRILFLDADDNTLIKRFSETRRRHPLTDPDHSLEDAIRRERTLLKPIADQADMIIDTTYTNIHQLRDRVQEQLGNEAAKSMTVMFQSFGYKHGVPSEADFVFDARCLPNPHWEPRLRALTGMDGPVVDFLDSQADAGLLFEDIRDFLTAWLPRFEADKRSYMTLAVGCTGGQHRSVYLVERLAAHFKETHNNVIVRHRELS